MPNPLKALIVACFAIAMFSACKKSATPPLAIASTTPQVVGTGRCFISRIVSLDKNNGDKTITFEYDSKGNPLLVTPSKIGTGSIQMVFRYDNKGRLTDMIGAYNNDYFEIWHKYIYNNRNRIIRDSVFHLGVRGAEPSGARVITYEDLEYDGEGRIIKLTSHIPGYAPVEVYYSYDANGNLARPGYTYDNKVSIYRTHDFWMFYFRNYSQNNAVAATAYNSNNLPLTFNAGAFPAPQYMFGQWTLNQGTVEYTCQ